MAIRGKNEIYLRFIGAFCILAGLVVSITFSVALLPTIYLFLLLVIIPLMLLSSCLKLELETVTNNLQLILTIISIFSLLMMIIGIILSTSFSISLSFMVFLISNLLIVICWHFCLSLYRKKKFFFIVSGLGSISLSTIFHLFEVKWSLFLDILPSVLILCGMLLITITELIMKKKGLLNYL